MAHRLTAVVLLLALSAACATPPAVRLDTRQGAPREYRPRASGKSVEVSANDFEEALTRLVLEAPLPLRSSRRGGLVLASYPAHDADARWQRLMSRSFHGFCPAGQRGGGCLSLLDDVMGLSEGDKLGVAPGLSRQVYNRPEMRARFPDGF